jgi:hypothetical protein
MNFFLLFVWWFFGAIVFISFPRSKGRTTRSPEGAWEYFHLLVAVLFGLLLVPMMWPTVLYIDRVTIDKEALLPVANSHYE